MANAGALQTVYQAVVDGDAPAAEAAVKAALALSIPPATIINDSLIRAMAEVGRLFEISEYFVPELLISARAMKQCMALLKPHLTASDRASKSIKVAIGTVKGDIHDIGKNLVGSMLEGYGFEVMDLGADVAPEKFVEAVKTGGAEVVGMSALLTTTMPTMADVITSLKAAGIRDKCKVLVGGAPVTAAYAKQIGADGYSPDASSAARLTKSLFGM
eukprot:TRINITY_DN2784_c0_g1_i12.p1 TRINITY_DN2784_c0_g1~~TRINITY_DN2784_c0_g1_i12.p1  ORF type:complete len:251 (-),score=151.80 TRINITY_DN2784_c0_g1_i12:87-734(-)